MDTPGAKPFPHWPNTVTRTQLWVSPKFWVLTSAALGTHLDMHCMLIQVRRSHVHCLEFGCESEWVSEENIGYTSHLLANSKLYEWNSTGQKGLRAWHMLKGIQINTVKMGLHHEKYMHFSNELKHSGPRIHFDITNQISKCFLCLFLKSTEF